MGRQSSQGWTYANYSANNAGAVLGATGPAGTSASIPLIEGVLHSITLSADTTATTITVYDNTAASGTVLFKVVTPTAVPVTQLILDLQAKNGLTVVIAGASTPNINVAYS